MGGSFRGTLFGEPFDNGKLFESAVKDARKALAGDKKLRAEAAKGGGFLTEDGKKSQTRTITSKHLTALERFGENQSRIVAAENLLECPTGNDSAPDSGLTRKDPQFSNFEKVSLHADEKAFLGKTFRVDGALLYVTSLAPGKNHVHCLDVTSRTFVTNIHTVRLTAQVSDDREAVQDELVAA